MTVRELYNKLQELPLERFDDEVKIWYADGDRFDLDFVDDTIDGVIELNVGSYDDEHVVSEGSGAGSGLPGEDEVWNLLTNAMKPILKDYKDKLAKKKDNNHPSIH